MWPCLLAEDQGLAQAELGGAWEAGQGLQAYSVHIPPSDPAIPLGLVLEA